MRKLLMLFLGISMLVSQAAFSQANPLRGSVKDANGQPVIGASVKVASSNVGTVTDVSGNFSLNVKPGQKLIVSAIGYGELEVTAAEGMIVSLTQDIQSMSEVIVTGVAGATSRKKMTVSVTKISEERLNAVTATSMSSALSGKVAGVKTSSPSGGPGGGLDILLRGDNNLNNVGSGPLILIDGVILTGGLSDINADDVESMEVVKGAAASALYGSRAGNGVIAITTKRGSNMAINSSSVTVRNEIGFQSIANKLDLATHHPYALASDWQSVQGQYTKYAGVTYPSGYKGGGFNPDIVGNRTIDADHYLDNPFGVTIDQQDKFFTTGTNYTNYVGIGSRSAKTNIFASFENNSQEGVIQHTEGYKRQNFRLNMDHMVAPWLKLTTSNLFINTQTQYPGNGSSIFFNIVLAEPDLDLLAPNPDGQPYYLRMNHFNGETVNPLYNIYKQERDDKTRRWIGNYAANIKLARWANVDVSHSIEIGNYRYTSYNPYDTWSLGGGGAYNMNYSKGSLQKYSDETNSQNTQATLNLSHKFGDLGVRGKLSYLFENRQYENYQVSSQSFGVPDLPTFANFEGINSGASYMDEEKAQNYFAILGLDWRDKLLFDGMYRYDGSSLFGSEARWNSYYRVSGAYRISQDVKIPGIDELKVRAAYGTAGIRPGFSWQYETYSISNGVTSPSTLGNENLKPSQTAETEFGLNVDFLRKFTFEAIYAQSVTTDQFLLVQKIPFFNRGFNSRWENAGTVESNTIELSLGANWLNQKDFTWNSNIVFSRVRQEITELPIPPYLFGSTDGGGGQMFYVRGGEAYGAMYGFSWVRTLDQMAAQLPAGKAISDYEVNSDGYVVPAGSQGTVTEKAIRLKDEKGNDWYGKIGDGNADFNLGLANTFKYKGITLYFLFDMKQGGDVYNSKNQWITRDFRNAQMDMSGVPDGQKKTYDYFLQFYDVNSVNSYWVEDASYIKLRELALGYSFPQNFLGKFNNVFKGITAKVIGRNLLTFTDYSGYDPEVGSLRQPYDGTYKYPNFRNVAFSLSFDF